MFGLYVIGIWIVLVWVSLLILESLSLVKPFNCLMINLMWKFGTRPIVCKSAYRLFRNDTCTPPFIIGVGFGKSPQIPELDNSFHLQCRSVWLLRILFALDALPLIISAMLALIRLKLLFMSFVMPECNSILAVPLTLFLFILGSTITAYLVSIILLVSLHLVFSLLLVGVSGLIKTGTFSEGIQCLISWYLFLILDKSLLYHDVVAQAVEWHFICSHPPRMLC